MVTEMTPEECRDELGRMGFGRLACAHENQPYVVPIFFAAEGDYVYSFSIAGKKVDWMRDNPRVCLEVDSVRSWKDWTSVIALGQFEELPDTPDWQAERQRAHSLLRQRAMWWQPASADVKGHSGEVFLPVFFRIILEGLTGHRGSSAPDSARFVGDDRSRGGWLRQLFRPAESKL